MLDLGGVKLFDQFQRMFAQRLAALDRYKAFQNKHAGGAKVFDHLRTKSAISGRRIRG